MHRNRIIALACTLSVGTEIGCGAVATDGDDDAAFGATTEPLRPRVDPEFPDEDGGDDTGEIPVTCPWNDLVMDGTMFIESDGISSAQGIGINVRNTGTRTAAGWSRVKINGRSFPARVLQKYTASRENYTIEPSQSGFVWFNSPDTVVSECTAYFVEIDIDHVWQDACLSASPVTNDKGYAWACQLKWGTPITPARLAPAPTAGPGVGPSADAPPVGAISDGFEDAIWGKSLRQIVSSEVAILPGGSTLNGHTLIPSPARCSDCHFKPQQTWLQGLGYTYRPDQVPMGSAGPVIRSYTPIPISTGTNWTNSWASKFVRTGYPKPEVLRRAFAKWLKDDAFE